MVHHGELLIDGHFIGGPCDQATGKDVLRSPWDGRVVGVAAEGNATDLLGAIGAAQSAFDTWRHSTRRERQQVLRGTAQRVRDRADELSALLSAEAGKPVTQAKGEVARLAITFDHAADLLSSWGLEAIPADLDARGENARILVERVPRGVILGIVPYNWPLNLAAHKVAPALATGNTIVLKTSPLAPLSTLELGRILHEAGAPPGTINVWNGSTRDADRAIEDPRLAMLSFTGSENVGWSLKARRPDIPVTLELGGDATVVVMNDADLEKAVDKIAFGAFAYAGQICISVQHILVQRDLCARFKESLIAKIRALKTGDPADLDVVCGPLISEAAADKVRAFIAEATAQTATRLTGDDGKGSFVPPTLLENVSYDAKLATEEAFGPVATLSPFDTLEEAAARINRSRFGIQAGIFTASIATAEAAYRSFDVGGVIVNDVPTLRFDAMPYGGVRGSGFGREGVAEAMHEMTTPKTLVWRS